MILGKAPAKLKGDCLNQSDQAMRTLGLDFRVGLSLSPLIIDDHLASGLILEKFNTNENIRCDWKRVSSRSKLSTSDSQWILVSEDGDTYLIEKHHIDHFRLSVYSNPDEEVIAYEGSLVDLFRDLDIIPYALNIRRVSPSKENNVNANNGPSYIIRHLISQKKTAKVIIGISIMIALLGVVTP